MQATVPLDLSVSRPMLERLGHQLPVVLSLKIHLLYLLRRLEQESQKFTVTGRISHL